MPRLKHVPFENWPLADCVAWEAAFVPGDIFDEDGGPGAHLAPGSRASIMCAYRRWLGFLADKHREVLARAPAERLTPDLVHAFIEDLSAEVTANTVAVYGTHLYYAAKLIGPTLDWGWFRCVKSRLNAQTRPKDRFDRLVAPWQTLDHGIELMETADNIPSCGWLGRETQYRDGMVLAILALWPIRRRSLTVLTVSGHIERASDTLQFTLHPEDTKSRRAESFTPPEVLVSYIEYYLDHVRPHLLGDGQTDAFWVSCQGKALGGQDLYVIVRRRTHAAFGKAMGLHDFRRAAHTFLAMEAPDQVGLIPGVLQHASPEIGDQHYNLARSTAASRRHVAHVSDVRERLRDSWRRQQRRK